MVDMRKLSKAGQSIFHQQTHLSSKLGRYSDYKWTLRHRFVLIFACASLFLLLLLPWNELTSNYIASQIPAFLTINGNMAGVSEFWRNLTEIGDALIVLPLLSLLILRQPRTWASLIGGVPLASFLSVAGKHYFAMPRPAYVLNPDQINIVGPILGSATSSLPSGHTITVFTAATALIYGGLHHTHHPWYRNSLAVAVFLLAILVGFSRIVVGAHWPMDVIMGALFGILSGLSGVWLANRYTSWWHWMNHPRARFIHISMLIALGIGLIQAHSDLVMAWFALGAMSTTIFQLAIAPHH